MPELPTEDTALDTGDAVSDMDIMNQPEPDPVVDPAPEPEVAPAVPAVDPAIAPTPDPNAPPADQPKVDAAKPTEAAKPAEPELPASVKALREKIEGNAELRAALDKDPVLRNRLFADARRSMELNDFKTEFATLDIAKMARQSAEDLQDLESAYTARLQDGSPDPAGFEALLDRMSQFSMLRDAAGNPLLDQQGRALSNGTIEGFFTHHRQQYFWPEIEQLAANNPELLNAVRLVKQSIGDAPAGQPQQQADPARPQDQPLPEHIRQRLARLDSLERQQGKQSEEATRVYEQGVTDAVVADVKSTLEARVKAYAGSLSPAIQRRIVEDTFADIGARARGDVLYRNGYLAVLRRANGSDTSKQQLVNMAREYAKNVAGPMIQKHVKEFSSELVQQTEQKVAKLDAQKAKANVKGTGAGKAPVAQGDVHSMIREGNQLTQKLFGRSLRELEILNIEEDLPKFQKMLTDRSRPN